jgi:hypothetical protein
VQGLTVRQGPAIDDRALQDWKPAYTEVAEVAAAGSVATQPGPAKERAGLATITSALSSAVSGMPDACVSSEPSAASMMANQEQLQQENSTNSSQELADALCQTSTSLRAILTHKSVDACHLPNENLSGSSSPRDDKSLCEAQSASTAQNQSSCQQSVKGNAAAHFAAGMLADTVDNVEVQFPADARRRTCCACPPQHMCLPD